MYFKEQASVAIMRFIAASITLLAFAGCTTSTIVADGKNVSVPSVRVAVNLDDAASPAEPHTGHAIEFGHARAKGHADQALTTGQAPIVYDNLTYTAPQQLRHEFDFNYTDLSWRWRKFFGERTLGLELSAGLAHTSLDLTVISATQRGTGKFTSNGAQGGVGLVWRLGTSTSLHARLAGFASSNSPGVSNLGRYELFLSQSLGDNLALRAGYAKWEMTGKSGGLSSNFKVSYSGPTAELGVHF